LSDIRLQNEILEIPVKTQGHRNRHGSICHLWLTINVS